MNPLNKDCKSKLLETTKQLSSTEHLLSKTTDHLAEAKDQLSYAKSKLLTANNYLTRISKSESSTMQKKCTTLYSRYIVKLRINVITEGLLAKDDKMVKYYTGLSSYEVLKAVYDLVTIGIPSSYSFYKFMQFVPAVIICVEALLEPWWGSRYCIQICS